MLKFELQLLLSSTNYILYSIAVFLIVIIANTLQQRNKLVIQLTHNLSFI